MIYLKHNVKGNFMHASGVGDNQMKEDIILSEIAKLIVVKPELVVEYLNKAGLPVKGVPGKRKLTKLVSDGLNKSKEFASLLAKEIVGAGTTLNGDGDGGATSGGTDWAALATSTVSIVASLQQMFGGGKKDPPKQTQQQLYNQVNAVHNIANDGWSTETKVLIGFAIAVPVLVGSFFAIRALRS